MQAKQKDITQTQVRIPTALLDELKEQADKNLRSLNAEIIYSLQIGLGKSQPHATPEEVRQIVKDELRKAGK